MDWFEVFSADKLMASFLSLCLIREAMIAFLPESLVGPGGRLIDTDSN